MHLEILLCVLILHIYNILFLIEKLAVIRLFTYKVKQIFTAEAIGLTSNREPRIVGKFLKGVAKMPVLI